MLKASSGSSGLAADYPAQSAGMLKPTSKSFLLLRCLEAAKSVFTFQPACPCKQVNIVHFQRDRRN